MIFEIIILALSVRRGLQYRSTIWADNRTTISGRKSLIYILLRDSLLFPFVGLSICFLNFMGSIYFSFSATQICIIIAGFSTQILGSRLVLNLREAYYQPFEDEFSLDRISLPLQFVEQPRESNCSHTGSDP
ncbi:hypothetical protein CPC08DRAFT_73379 [Agrocybe pediades]|nr:hypothetical protein CPC08DRAFT_73379 [Agrocybe pediades]